MLIFVDIDDTICRIPLIPDNETPDYSNAEPIMKNIEKINDLYYRGHTIIYWTARGTLTGIDWSEVTHYQFEKWGVKYNEIRFGKPAFDLFIDDKALNSLDHFNDLENYVFDE